MAVAPRMETEEPMRTLFSQLGSPFASLQQERSVWTGDAVEAEPSLTLDEVIVELDPTTPNASRDASGAY